MFENGRPRYWIDWYDRWYLLLPLLLTGVLVVIWRLPTPAPERLSPGIRGALPSRAGSPTVPTPLPPLAPTTLESPQNGKGFFQSRIADAEGHAEPGAMVHLEYAGPDLVWRELSRMPANASGRFHFQLRNFPPGSYRLRARAVTNSGRSALSGEAMIAIAADPRPEPRRRRPKN